MSQPAMKAQRRQLPRTNLGCLAYIHFEPDNGGIVLNISEEGLCFHAVAPLEVNTKASLWFSGASSRIAAEGLVVWADDTRKKGGLRFNHLSPEARRHIRMWMDQSSKPLARSTQVPAPMPQSTSDSPMANRAYVGASAVLRSFWRRVLTPPRWSEFSRGLVTGLLFALFVATLFSLHARQRIGDALIWLGERFEPTPQPRVAASSSDWSTPSAPELTVQAHMRVPPAAVIPVSTPAPRRDKPSLPTLKTVAPRIHSKLPPAMTPAPAVPSPLITSLPLLSPAPTSVSVPPQGARLASPEKVLAAKAVDRSDESENAEDILEINSDMPLGKYFEVGKFKDELAANQRRRDLEELGFRTAVLPKSGLWMKSYEVFVGPYHDEQDAQRARRNLHADGLKPRSLGEHSRQLTLVAPSVNPAGGAAERDDFIVTWEAYSEEANVKLVEASQIGRTVTGKWVKLPARSDYTAIVYTTGRTGARTLLSIQFRGMNQAVMLANSTDNSIVF
jgi:PilZ domain/SPOR domain